MVELLISMAVFLLVLGMVFLLFGISSRGFRTVEARQLAQNQLAAIRGAFQRDLQASHFYGIHLDTGNVMTIAGTSQRRDALSAVHLSQEDRRDEFGVPNWDQWTVFRVTREEQGQLLRHVVRPRGGEGRQLLRAADGLAELARQVAVHDPTWGRVSPPQVLARGVRSLRANLDASTRTVELEVTIAQVTDPRNPRPDIITSIFVIKPHNTVPTD